VFGERQGGGRVLPVIAKNGVADGWKNRREGGFAEGPVGELSVFRKWTSISGGT